MSRVYVAGPMRGYPRFNFDAFDEAAEYLRGEGFVVVNPAEIDRSLGLNPDEPLPDWFTVEDALRRDFREILDCDGIVLLPGWEKSTGATAEKFVAEKAGRFVEFYNPDARFGARLSPGDPFDHDEPAKPDYMPGTGEVRVVNAETGGEKGSKLARYDLIPAEPLRLLAEHYGRGSLKYADRNWERGYDWSLSFAALNRHLWQFWNGEDVDAETGSPHMAAVAWHAFTLLEFARTHPALDNRPSTRDEAA